MDRLGNVAAPEAEGAAPGACGAEATGAEGAPGATEGLEMLGPLALGSTFKLNPPGSEKGNGE